jgi:hypothetical protein
MGALPLAHWDSAAQACARFARRKASSEAPRAQQGGAYRKTVVYNDKSETLLRKA